MLQQMRGLAKYIWVLVALVFVGGFLLYETSGLMGRTPVTASTAVAVVNGHEVPYNVYLQRVQNEVQAEQQRDPSRSLSQDDNRRIENSVFDQMVAEILLSDQYRKRGIVVTDDEVREFARYAPPQWITSAPELQTNGRFDPEKYQRYLGSAQARQSGLLFSLEQYYRSEIPREKLFDQIQSGTYVSDPELWRAWQDQHDSAQVSFVSFVPTPDTMAAKAISDADLRTYFDQHKGEFQGTGSANLTVVTIPKVITAADTAAARAKAAAVREEIVKGAKFEDVAKRESADSASGAQGGDLGKSGKGRYFPEFEKAAYALKVGEISQPVLSPVRLPHHSRRRAQGRHARRAPHPDHDSRERFGNHPRRQGSGPAVARLGELGTGRQARHRRTRAQAARVQGPGARGSARDHGWPHDSERERLGVRRGQARRDERPVRR